MKLLLIKELNPTYSLSKRREKQYKCVYRCFCGNEFVAQKKNVESGNTKSCGCLQKRRASETKKKHGDSKTRLYKIYYHIKTRCSNKKHIQYQDWGGRGITICDEWKSNYKEFKKWALANGYRKDLSIDRIDNDGNYEPSNCRWSVKEIQSRNTRKIYRNNKSGYRGVYYKKDRKKWYSKICVNSRNIFLGSYTNKIMAAYAYDSYVLKNKLEHTRNFMALGSKGLDTKNILDRS